MVVYAKAFDGEETEEEAVQAILLVAVSVDNSYHRSWVSTSTYPITFCVANRAFGISPSWLTVLPLTPSGYGSECYIEIIHERDAVYALCMDFNLPGWWGVCFTSGDCSYALFNHRS